MPPERQAHHKELKVLSLLRTIDLADGALLVSDEELAALEEEQFFIYASKQKLIRLDFGGEWTSGGVIFITSKGRLYLYLGKQQKQPSWRKFIESCLGGFKGRLRE
jgi:hypothetical protein